MQPVKRVKLNTTGLGKVSTACMQMGKHAWKAYGSPSCNTLASRTQAHTYRDLLLYLPLKSQQFVCYIPPTLRVHLMLNRHTAAGFRASLEGAITESQLAQESQAVYQLGPEDAGQAREAAV